MVAVRGDHLVAVSGVEGDAGGRAVVLRDGHALASSSWNALIWSNDDGVAAHHLIDPATGAPAEPASAVVIASDAGEADALATALAVRPELVSRLTTCAMVHTDQGERHTAPWEAVAVYRPLGARPQVGGQTALAPPGGNRGLVARRRPDPVAGASQPHVWVWPQTCGRWFVRRRLRG